jgi:hypothetical protein
MPVLSSELRNKLERVVIEARNAAEVGARTALETLAVHHFEPYPHMNPVQRELRNHLRAKARQLGDRQDTSGRLTIDHLAGECTYEHWHRMLFARFLAENNLLIEPQENMAISLAEAEELAKEGGVDVWVFASRCAQRMLPQIFRPDDPLLQVSFATEHRIKLEKLLASLPQAVFTASDALGWVYQFWQRKKKKEVNRSEVKIGADKISVVTQFFTEPYMVLFLLHNTLGAWWAGKKLTADDLKNASSEEELRRKIALPGVNWEYLRFVREPSGSWRPAAGTFDGWPKTIRLLKLLDPCCGSGHFLVAALYILVAMRMVEEDLSAREAVDAVLCDNLHGLEIDERCCQIDAFALAFAAWTFPNLPSPSGRGVGGEGAIGYRELPDLHIACTGIGPQSTEEQWVKLAEQSGMPARPDECERIKNGLLNLHRLFSQAPTLGSLIDPKQLEGDAFAANFETIQPYLAAILKAETADDEIRERAIAATGMVKAAELLAGEYVLVITNVPYLGWLKQDDILKEYLEKQYPLGKADLATAFVLRCLEFCGKGGSTALVTPQNWLFLTTYTKIRKRLLDRCEWNIVARLGPGAFETIGGHVVNVTLLALSAATPTYAHTMAGIDVSAAKQPDEKAVLLRGDQPAAISFMNQAGQLHNPDYRVTLELGSDLPLLNEYAQSLQGTTSGDNPRFVAAFWEIDQRSRAWSWFQTPCDEGVEFGGCHQVLRWEEGRGELAVSPSARVQGQAAFWRRGFMVRQMSTLPVSHYLGEMFDMNGAVIVPEQDANKVAVWAYLCSSDFRAEVRRIDAKLNVTNATLAKVHYDLAHWQKIAAEKYSDGLPEPESDDPTQWLFHGRPEESTALLQVAVARLLGYRWPAEHPHPNPLPEGEGDKPMRLSERARVLVERCDELAKFADNDGIVCITSIRGEEPAAERLLALLAVCGIQPDKVRELAGGIELDDWLRNSFFEEHCKLFHDRPFVWHIWDGRKRDGFHALVNYHKLCEGGGKGRKLLESLTYSYLGDWIIRQRDGVKRGEGGAEDRLAAAVELQKRLVAILEGEPPYDIFVRWKPLAGQPIGWEPDINDGVRVNIRPFLASDLPGGRTGAGVLRWKPNIKWAKDRGKEPERLKVEYPWFWGWDEKTEDFAGGRTFDGNRWNDCHYTNKAKQAAREASLKQ